MKRVNSYSIAILLAATLAAPAVLVAAPAAQDDRVYDRDHKDYHHWDEHENQAWHRYLAEQHRQDHEFVKANKKEQEEYWNWRHSHPD
jgi:type III secretory pathway component EscR